MIRSSLIAIASLSFVAVTSWASVVVHLNDDFSDGNRAKTGALDANWYRTHADTASVSIDSNAGFTDALVVDRTGVGGSGSVHGVVATLSAPVSLGSQVGDQLRLSFDARLFNAAGNSLADSPTGFRFALYNLNTPRTADDQGDAPGPGYVITHQTGNTGYARLYSQTGILTSGGLTQRGGDFGSFFIGSNANTAGAPLATFVLNMTRTDTGIDFAYYAAAQGAINPDDLTGLTPQLTWSELTADIVADTFNTVYVASVFGTATNNNDYRLDHVKLQTIPIPEPASLGLIGLGALTLLARRRVR